MISLSTVETGIVARAHEREPLVVDSDGVVLAEGWREGDDAVVDVPHVAAYRYRRRSHDVAAVAEPGGDEDDVRSTYHSTVLPVLVQAVTDWEVFHASAVAGGNGVVAFCGSSEAGKTTIGHGLARRGHTLWADDAVAFQAEAADTRTVALPFVADLREESETHFSSGDTAVAHATPGEEGLLRRVVIVEPGANAVSIERLAPPDAIVALLPNAYRFRPATAERERQMVASYLELVAHVPVLRLRYAKDWARFDRLLDTIHDAVLS